MKRMVFLMAWGWLALTALFAGCSGGGGDSGGEIDPPPQAPTSLYTYEVKGLMPDADKPPGMMVGWEVTDGVIGTFRVHPNPSNSSGFTGTIDPDSRDITISQGAGCDVYDVTVESAQFGIRNFQTIVGTTLVMPSGGPPIAGVIQIEPLPGAGDPFAVRITFSATAPNVRVEYDEDGDGSFGAPENLTYEAFETYRTSLDERQRLACFAIDVFRFLLTQIDLVAYGLDWIGANEDRMDPSYAALGDSFGGANLTPPDGIQDRGRFEATWNDDSGNNELGPGDAFVFDMDQVWIASTDLILDGTATLSGFTDVVSSDDKTVRIGFEPYGGTLGGIFLTDWTEHFTRTIGTEVTIHSTYTINGALSIVFQID